MLSIMTMAVIAAGPLLPDAVPAAIDRHAPNLIQHAQEPLANRPRWVGSRCLPRAPASYLSRPSLNRWGRMLEQGGLWH